MLDYSLEANKGSYFQENDRKSNSEIKQPDKLESNVLSEASKSPLNPLSESQNIYSNQNKGLHGANFIALGNLSEQEKTEVIRLGFQMQSQGKISLKKYYESTDPNSLFQLKGYNIKYETIRPTQLYQQLKLKL